MSITCSVGETGLVVGFLDLSDFDPEVGLVDLHFEACDSCDLASLFLGDVAGNLEVGVHERVLRPFSVHPRVVVVDLETHVSSVVGVLLSRHHQADLDALDHAVLVGLEQQVDGVFVDVGHLLLNRGVASRREVSTNQESGS